MQKLIFLILLFPFIIFSQEIKISGTVKDNQNGGIESASVVVLDDDENTLTYGYSDENGTYNLVFDNPKNNIITIVAASLGYSKKEIKLDCSSKTTLTASFTLEEKLESLKVLVI
jgi:hypothetical protein